ncbi:hypothetical protein H0H92_004523 [Tricholoma furcatifolium]|nr:hypothetical protein H0H92_004523 [Tricholoma furcatifolium]
MPHCVALLAAVVMISIYYLTKRPFLLMYSNGSAFLSDLFTQIAPPALDFIPAILDLPPRDDDNLDLVYAELTPSIPPSTEHCSADVPLNVQIELGIATIALILRQENASLEALPFDDDPYFPSNGYEGDDDDPPLPDPPAFQFLLGSTAAEWLWFEPVLNYFDNHVEWLGSSTTHCGFDSHGPSGVGGPSGKSF